jgi:hypothetical protein
MSFNEKIKQIKRDNYTTKPTNIEPWVNPFLRLSDNEIYNKLLISDIGNILNDGNEIDGNDDNETLINNDNNNPRNIINKKNKINANVNNKLSKSSISTTLSPEESENLARHIMSEVYTAPDERRNMEGYRLSKSLSTEEHVVYVGNKGKNILLGLRGSASVKDFVADGQIGAKTLFGLPDTLSNTLNNRYNRDENVYNAIRSKYPNKHIVMAGHSLGNALGMNILKNHKNDKNITFYGYNGWFHPDYNKDKRAFTTRQEGDLVSLATPNDNTIKLTKAESAAVSAGTATMAGIYAKRISVKASKEQLSELLATNNLKHDFILKAQETTLNEGNTFALNDGIATHFPEYTSLKEIIANTTNTATDYSVVNRIPNLFIKKDKVEAFNEFLVDNFDGDTVDAEYNFDDLIEEIQEHNAKIDIAANPSLTDVTDQLVINDTLSEDYLHNIYISNYVDNPSPSGEVANLDALENVEELVKSGMVGDGSDIRITSSQQLETEGSIQLTPFEDIVEGTNTDIERTIAAETAELAAIETAETALAYSLGIFGAIGLAGAGIYYGWSHSVKRFKIKNNLFLK